MRRRYIRCASIASMLSLLPLMATAQTREDGTKEEARQAWYIGVQGGVPFGVSTFSSFGADKTRAGWDAGLYGGYRFNPVLSLEAQAAWGKINQSTRECCSGYWLGSDGQRYDAEVAGMTGWNYTDLKSRTFIQRYGLQLNVNVLGLFPRTKYSRWTLDLSPHIAAMGTKSTLQSMGNGNDIMEGNNRWHLGVGGNLQAGFRITRQFAVGIYSGITYLTGKPMDGLPDYRHDCNFIWESGLRLGWTFGKKKKRTSGQDHPVHTAAEPKRYMPPVTDATDSPAEPAEATTVTVEQKDGTPSGTAATDSRPAIQFPTLYFPFNGTSIAETELPKAHRILELLRKHPETRVTITGWCDSRGSREVNERISLRRAEAVKAWLVAQGIAEERILTIGKGSDFNAKDAKDARRADTESYKGKEGGR